MLIDIENYKPGYFFSFFSFICQKAQRQTYSSIMGTESFGSHIYITFLIYTSLIQIFMYISLFYYMGFYMRPQLLQNPERNRDDTLMPSQVGRPINK